MTKVVSRYVKAHQGRNEGNLIVPSRAVGLLGWCMNWGSLIFQLSTEFYLRTLHYENKVDWLY